ncbi:hypothetical protein ACIA5G_39275 [Amycolatopsis sp. NPDC051758]|uniref:hypothetical protein n=1 Tax=Amycolatopsis sp. NPDC051758 TaxID=3363935 RepID=UPI0037AFFFB6
MLALTDHDTFAGLAAATSATSEVEIVPGIEISCRLDDAEVHLLDLFVDPLLSRHDSTAELSPP